MCRRPLPPRYRFSVVQPIQTPNSHPRPPKSWRDPFLATLGRLGAVFWSPDSSMSLLISSNICALVFPVVHRLDRPRNSSGCCRPLPRIRRLGKPKAHLCLPLGSSSHWSMPPLALGFFFFCFAERGTHMEFNDFH